MPSAEKGRRRPLPSIALPVALALAILTSLMPLLRVVAPAGWTAGVVAGVLVVLGAAWISRRGGLAAPYVSLIAAAAGGIYLTAVFARDTALLWLVPTPETFRSIGPAFEGAVEEIIIGAAPVIAGPDLTFLIVAAAVVLALALDHVVITTRMPLLASAALIAVYLIPALAVRSSIRIPEFVGFSLALLLLFALDTRIRERARLAVERRAQRLEGGAATFSRDTAGGGAPSGASGIATAAAIAAVAVIAAVAITPALPPPAQQAGAFSSGSAIDASLALGDNLRLPEPIEVLRVQTTAVTPPYLRAVTLSSFDGGVWQPDRGEGEALGAFSFDDLSVDSDVRQIEVQTSVEVVNYVSPWLPVPFPAVSVEGLEGSWTVLDENRTVLTRDGSPQGQDYLVESQVPRPTLEQARAAVAEPEVGWGPRDIVVLDGDERVIRGIREVALEVTAGADTDYDRLIAMQTWFRTQFEYSLDAPVAAGFDGSGLEAIAAFLDERSGYCVHFASAFAVMARTLDMPSRIVVGYLPGTGTGETRDGEPVYSVSSSQLHAWPEVHFSGIGWIPFEPTTSLGTATRFWPEASGVVDDTGNPVSPEPSTAPSTAPSAAPETDRDTPDATDASLGRSIDALPTVSIALLVLAVLAAPAIARIVRRARRLRAAEWEAAPAWAEVIDTAIDLGIPLPPGESARSLGRRLVVMHGAPRESVDALVAAIEHVSYAPHATSWSISPGTAEEVRAVRDALLRSCPPTTRALAILAPRSLVVRPGSAMAAGAPAR